MFIDYSKIPLNREQHKKAVRIIHNLLNMPESVSFRKPVCYRALGLDDYKQIVKKPIDLNMIRRINNEWKYKYLEQMLDDIQMCWNNCRAYNKPQSEIYQAAVRMEDIFVQQLLQQYPDYVIPQGIIKGRELFVPLRIQKPPKIMIRPQERSPRERQSKEFKEMRQQRERQREARQARQRQARQARQARQRQRQTRQYQRQVRQRDMRQAQMRMMPQQIVDHYQNVVPVEQIYEQSNQQMSNEAKKDKKAIKQLKMIRKQQQKGEQLVASQSMIIKVNERASLQNILQLSHRMKAITNKQILRGVLQIVQQQQPGLTEKNSNQRYKLNASLMSLSSYNKILEYLQNNK